MKSKTTDRFWKCYQALPDEIKKKAKQAYTQFERDPWYPSLHFKRVHSSLPIYSVRITKDYRAVSILRGEMVIWFWTGSHSDYEKLLSQIKRA